MGELKLRVPKNLLQVKVIGNIEFLYFFSNMWQLERKNFIFVSFLIVCRDEVLGKQDRKLACRSIAEKKSSPFYGWLAGCLLTGISC
jgi:hypothetical protein